MSKKRISSIAAFIVLIIPVLLVLTGCPQHIDSLYGLKVTGDGAGGAITLYEDELGGDIYAQKISSDGKTMWGEKGVLLGSSDSKAYSFFNLNIISNSFGGAIVVWPDSSKDQFRPTSYLARIDVEGKVVWQRDFIYFNQMISDGSGGAIIAFDYSAGIDIIGDESEDLTLVRVDAQGDYPWGLQGVSVPRQRYQDNTLQMTPDGSGGVIVVWEELESQAGATPGNARNINRLFAQRIDSGGKLLWKDSVLLYTTPNGTWIESPQAAGDGVGGAVVSWFQVTENPTDSTGHRSQIWDIAAQKIDADGNIRWQSGGVPLEITKTSYNAAPSNPAMTSDDSGGAIIIWRDGRSDEKGQASVYAQHIDADGNLKWQAGGIKVSSASLNPRAQVISSGSGAVLISYSFQEDWKILNIQKLDGNGQTLWQENGVPMVEGGFAGYSVSPDGQGGMIVGWGVGKGTFSSEKAYVQRVSAEGKMLWGEEGTRLNK